MVQSIFYPSLVNEGKMASEKICQHVDDCPTCNPDHPDNGMCTRPSTHPCQIYHKMLRTVTVTMLIC